MCMSTVAYTFAYNFVRIVAFARAFAFDRRTSHFALRTSHFALRTSHFNLRPPPCARRPAPVALRSPLSVLQRSELASAAARSLALAISKQRTLYPRSLTKPL